LSSKAAACRPLVLTENGGWRLNHFSKGIAKTQLKRDNKAKLLASIRAGTCDPLHGMTRAEAITILSQDVADYDHILARFEEHGKP
jgi:hypothetical protein